MARLMGRLTELQVRRLGRGWRNDGGGLYLRIVDKERRWWVFRYGAGGKRYHGLGPLATVSLAEAREQARACRALLLKGEDPIAAGKAHRAAAALQAANARHLPSASRRIGKHIVRRGPTRSTPGNGRPR